LITGPAIPASLPWAQLRARSPLRFLAVAVAGLLLARCGGSSGPSPTSPVISGIDPNHGPAGGGTAIHITGDHFAGGAVVTIGGSMATDVVVESATSITAKTGIRTPGASDVTVSVGGRTGALPAGFTYEADTAPTITSITVQGTRPSEPKNFADLDEEVAVTAVVDDPDTPAERLTFEWSAEEGTINGTGANVTWRAPTDAATPKSVVLTLKVSDPGSNTTTGTVSVSLHNSSKEVGDLSRQFLLDFSDSNTTPAFVVRNFSKSPRCERERDEEFAEVDTNRHTYRITSSNIGPATVKIQFASLPCSYQPRDGDACASVPSAWDSVCAPGATCMPGRTQGIDYVTAVFEDSQWKLCASYFQSGGTVQPHFIK
jgi:IPT/TIG domain-containing protein